MKANSLYKQFEEETGLEYFYWLEDFGKLVPVEYSEWLENKLTNNKIPSSFNLFASKIEVVFDNQRLSNDSALGDCSFIENKISLCDNYKGEPICESSIIDTFYHEKVHVILDAMNEHDLSENEKFVDVFSKLLRQSDETSVINKIDNESKRDK